ncbi:MAG: hypothetical protein L0177_15505 [Chloroflexi bacterium]|nr:hypothetical protein [Chloroflexota bacterium]
MSRLRGRIIRLERRLPTGLKAELQAMSDEELYERIAELEGITVEELRAQSDEERERRMDELKAELSDDGAVVLRRALRPAT